MSNQIIKSIRQLNLKRKQSKLNREYKRYGLTDEVLEKQIAINAERNKYNIPDESNFTYENFVQ